MVLVRDRSCTARTDVSGVDHDLPAHLVRGVITCGLCVLLEFLSGLNDDGCSNGSDQNQCDEHDHGANTDGCDLVVLHGISVRVGLQMTTSPFPTPPP